MAAESADLSSPEIIEEGPEDVDSELVSSNYNLLLIEKIEGIDGVNSDDKRKAISELKRAKSLCVMACGLTGAGKSTLLNGLSGKEVFKAADLEPVTAEVEMQVLSKENSTLTLCDTPGFEDGSGNEDEYLREIKGKCAKVDTLFYCISVSAVRIKMKDDLTTLQKLYTALDKKVWNSCVIVLTFANTMIDRIKSSSGVCSDDELKDEYYKRMNMWEDRVRETFLSAGINPTEMPLVHAGIATTPLLFSSDEKPWLSTFFEAVNDISPPDGQNVLFHINIERIAFDYKKSRKPRQLYKQDLIIKKETLYERLKARFADIAAAISTDVTGLAGTGVGAIIGGLALSPFRASGLGLLLGGLIGSNIGTSFTGKVIEKVKNKKLQ